MQPPPIAKLLRNLLKIDGGNELIVVRMFLLVKTPIGGGGTYATADFQQQKTPGPYEP